MQTVDLTIALRAWVEVAPATQHTRLLEAAIDELERLEQLERVALRLGQALSDDTATHPTGGHPDIQQLLRLARG